MNSLYRQWTTQYRDDVWSLARYMLKDASEAEDAAQEVFVRLWQKRKQVDVERLRPWLMRVTRNECLDRLRRARREDELDDNATVDGGPLTDMQEAEVSRWLNRAIGQLKEPYRSLVVLRDLRQHSYEDVAQTMELSMSQVKVYLYRARKQLREQLAEIKP